MKNNRSTKIIMSIEGGIGNQLFQIGAALSLFARDALTFEKLCVPGDVDKFDYEKIELFTKCKIGIRQVKSSQRRILNLCLRLSSWKRKQGQPSIIPLLQPLLSITYSIIARERTNLVIAKGTGYFEPKIRQKSNNIVVGYFQSYRYASSIQFNDIVEESTNQFYINLKHRIEESEPIVMHVRLGDYLQDESIGVLNSEYFIRALLKIAESGKPIWVFSNDLKQAREMLSESENFDLNFIDDGGLSAIELLTLMTRGHGYVLSNSTFGWWAAYLRRNKNAKVIVPTPWFSGLQDPDLLIPDHWQQENRLLTDRRLY